MKSFENRTGKFEGVEEGVNYLTTTCGGCCGMGVAAKLEDLNRKLKRWGDSKDDVTVYLASCIVSDNYHNPPCPHKDYIGHLHFADGAEKTRSRHLQIN